jgi:hypothetical protein
MVKRSNLGWNEIDSLPLFEYLELRHLLEIDLEEERKRHEAEKQAVGQASRSQKQPKHNQHRQKFNKRK